MPNALLAAQSIVPKHLVNQLINNNNTFSHCEKQRTTYRQLARSDRLDMFHSQPAHMTAMQCTDTHSLLCWNLVAEAQPQLLKEDKREYCVRTEAYKRRNETLSNTQLQVSK